MIIIEHAFEAVLYGVEENETLGRIPLDTDWEPAVESVRLLGLRRGLLAPEELGCDATVSPIWHSTLGRPHVECIEVLIRAGRGQDVTQRFPLTYFAQAILSSSKTLEDEGKIRDSEEFNYYVTAYQNSEADRRGNERAYKINDAPPNIHIAEQDSDGLYDRSLPHGNRMEEDIPVFISAHVLEDAEKLTRESPTKETGGILLGNLCRDPKSRDLFMSVSEQLPAEYTESTSTHLTFTSETWVAVHAAIDLRRQSEMILGFWHSHIPIEWCRKCLPERRENCHWAKGFFSADDRALHRAIFPRAYSIALVETFTEAGVKHDLFGWRDGLIKSRGFNSVPVSHPSCVTNLESAGEHIS